ncbi:D-aminoacyl-tRNA deacylase [Parenemella sanctibonifatiensis]|uniref:D-aminoacyl-tRNA deacylase n=1 Tax=Parenemella sanctibonifatiensis TaxID=2016505 RepID=A0A255ELV2_9ACTN|nr:D-aminoacyl-tRNA deacylase [Parenemella sanctibonifatiensis]OYN92529.1 D-tyrosyl-tRNA(Tyr) deacylase [Parenemella sanctibonifatiensis]
MRALVQRALSGEVRVAGEVVGRLPRPGLVVLVGVAHADTGAHAVELARKSHGLRILADETSAADRDAPFLVVSQFTLYADTRKGRRPSWSAAAPRPVSEPLVEAYIRALRDLGAHVETGIFGANMQVELVNDGPVTVLLEVPAPR